MCNALSQSKKRGLSLEDKREQLLQIFYESQDFFLVSYPSWTLHYIITVEILFWKFYCLLGM